MEARTAFIDMLKSLPSGMQARALNLLDSIQFKSELMQGGQVTFSISGASLIATVRTSDGRTLTGTVCALA